MTSETTIKGKHVVEMKWKLILHPEMRWEKQHGNGPPGSCQAPLSRNLSGAPLACGFGVRKRHEDQEARKGWQEPPNLPIISLHLLAGTNLHGQMQLRRRGWRGRTSCWTVLQSHQQGSDGHGDRLISKCLEGIWRTCLCSQTCATCRKLIAFTMMHMHVLTCCLLV